MLRKLFLFIAVALVAGTTFAKKDKKSQNTSHNQEIVATVGDKVITLEEVDRKALTQNLKVFQDLYNARRQALRGIVDDLLLNREASARDVTIEELTDTEITRKIKEVTDADVDAFFNTNQAQMRGQPLEQMGGQIRAFLQNRNRFEARKNFLDRLKNKENIQISLSPPRAQVRIADNDPVKGATDAVVTIVEFSDFQ